MFLKVKIKISVLTALIFIFTAPISAFQLAESVYTIPENSLELFAQGELYDRRDAYFNRERFGFGFGLFSRFSVSISFDYLQKGFFEGKEITMGDSSLRLWYYIGEFYDSFFRCGISLTFNIPTGSDVYYNQKWSGLALGRNEMTPAFVCVIGPYENLFLHLTAKYTFREGLDDDFYGGFRLNPAKSDTYSSLFGLNPVKSDTFMSGSRLKNDFFTFAAAINTDRFYPFIVYLECQKTFRPYRGSIETDDIPIEGAKLEPFLTGGGCRYFFSRETFLGLFMVVNPLPSDMYMRMRCGIEFGAVFLD